MRDFINNLFEEVHQSLNFLKENSMSGVRSKNNNVFKYNAYWRMWSRVLWHESDRKLQQQLGFDPRGCTWIELDLIPTNPQRNEEWYHVQVGNVRVHSTQMNYGDLIVGSLPPKVLVDMLGHMPQSNVDLLIHEDYLPYLDFEKGRLRNNGGFNPNDAFRDFISIERYLSEMRAGPGVFIEDIRESYDDAKAYWDKRIDRLRLNGDPEIEIVDDSQIIY